MDHAKMLSAQGDDKPIIDCRTIARGVCSFDGAQRVAWLSDKCLYSDSSFRWGTSLGSSSVSVLFAALFNEFQILNIHVVPP